MPRQPLKRELAAQNEALRADLSQAKLDLLAATSSRDHWKETAEHYNRSLESMNAELNKLREQLEANSQVLSTEHEAPATREELMARARRFSIAHKVPTRIENGAVKYFSNGHWHTAS